MRETNRISALREALASVSATLMLPEQVIRTLHSWVSCTSMVTRPPVKATCWDWISGAMAAANSAAPASSSVRV